MAMERLVVNVMTGEQTIVPFTPEEEAEIIARGQAEEARMAADREASKPTIEQLQAQLTAIQQQISSLSGS